MAEEAETKLATVRPPNLPSLYVNNAQVTMGLFEIRLYLSETTPGPDGKIVNTERLCLILAPEFAKFMGERLVKIMSQYEGQFGNLRKVEAEEPKLTEQAAVPE